MPYKDKQKAREYQREYQRRRRAESNEIHPDKPTIPYSLTCLEDLRTVFERITGDVMNADIDVGVKGRVIAQLLATGIRLFEKTDLEVRIAALERAAEQAAEQRNKSYMAALNRRIAELEKRRDSLPLRVPQTRSSSECAIWITW
jgi:predicted NUDIX family phosphoesterase